MTFELAAQTVINALAENVRRLESEADERYLTRGADPGGSPQGRGGRE